MKKSLIIGLTGPTGAGKTFFCRRLAGHFAHIDCDAIARQVVGKGSQGLAQLTKVFSKDILLPDGSLNRRELAKRALSDPDKTKLLNDITHPLITQQVECLINDYQRKRQNILLDAPLLFESGIDGICDLTVAILADRQTRRRRIMERDGLSGTQADLRLDAQKENDFYKKRADFVIVNSGNQADFEEQIKNFKLYIGRLMNEAQV